MVIEIVKEKICITNKKRTKADLADIFTRFVLTKTGTTGAMKLRLEKHLSDLQMDYNKNNIDSNLIQIDEGYLFESICPIPDIASLLAASKRSIFKICLIFD